ncbi:ABC transporter substrate-binding protein [Paenibacillus gansuensis]|uniref:ABC transporter substrate-binding protein n=1 Tax=Paenibacillus gansuensis TaxID=306542 RepID=A0ABW5PFZ5_9BACL
MRKIVTILLSMILLAGLLAACGDGGTNTKSEGTGTKASGEKVKLRMVESLTSPKRTELIKQAIESFEEQNPNITIELVSPPFDQADNKIRTMLSAKQDVDILEVRDLTVAEFVNNGYIEPLDALVDSWSDKGTLSPVARSVGTVDDKLFFIANGLYQRQMFYRKDWFDAKGLQPPTTWQELYETGKTLTDPAANRFGFSFRGGPGSNGNTDAMILSYNGDNVNLEDSMFLKDGKTVFSSPEAKQATELYMKIYKETSPPDSINWGFQEQVQAFTSGVTAILLQDPDVIQTLETGMDKNTWATAPMPKGPGGKALISAGGAGWGITSFSKNKDAAFKLISFLSSPQQNIEFSKKFGLIPIHSSASEDPFFQSGPYKTLLDMSNKPDDFVNYKPPFTYPGTGKWGEISSSSQQSYLLGKLSLDDLLKQWDQYWTDQKSQVSK